jgi:hypothetical protein
MKTLSEHEDFYSRLCDSGEKILDKIEAKLDKGEPMPAETVACMAKAVSSMMKAESKAIWGMRYGHHEHSETI